MRKTENAWSTKVYVLHDRATATRLLWCIWIFALVDLLKGDVSQAVVCLTWYHRQRNAPLMMALDVERTYRAPHRWYHEIFRV